MGFTGRDILALEDFSKAELLAVLKTSLLFSQMYDPQLLQGKLLASLFFEPSTRTRLSFEASMKKLGGNVIGFSDWKDTSIQKGEDLQDTIKVIDGYSDVIVIRHPDNGSAHAAAQIAKAPVINGGDGSNQHPTQTFVDLFTIFQSHGSLDGFSIGFLGDLKYGRTVHSLVKALKHFDVDMYFISPQELKMPRGVLDVVPPHRIKKETNDLYEVAGELDFVYATRIQKERFLVEEDYAKISSGYQLGMGFLTKAKKSVKIMHPLPRVGELQHELDESTNALYFQQAHNGIPVRMALLSLVLGYAQDVLDHGVVKSDVGLPIHH
jgi:aspartate carbamoyltransferase catalytic subunit